MATQKITVIISLPWSISFFVSFIRLVWLYDQNLRRREDIYYRVLIDLWFGMFTCLLLVVIYARILVIVGKHSRHVASQTAQLSLNRTQRSTQLRPARETISHFLSCFFLIIIHLLPRYNYFSVILYIKLLRTY